MCPRPRFEVIWCGEPSSDQAGLVRAVSFCVPTPEKIPGVKMGLWQVYHVICYQQNLCIVEWPFIVLITTKLICNCLWGLDDTFSLFQVLNWSLPFNFGVLKANSFKTLNLLIYWIVLFYIDIYIYIYIYIYQENWYLSLQTVLDVLTIFNFHSIKILLSYCGLWNKISLLDTLCELNYLKVNDSFIHSIYSIIEGVGCLYQLFICLSIPKWWGSLFVSLCVHHSLYLGQFK